MQMNEAAMAVGQSAFISNPEGNIFSNGGVIASRPIQHEIIHA